jgi:hypothetical protein
LSRSARVRHCTCSIRRADATGNRVVNQPTKSLAACRLYGHMRAHTTYGRPSVRPFVRLYAPATIDSLATLRGRHRCRSSAQDVSFPHPSRPPPAPPHRQSHWMAPLFDVAAASYLWRNDNVPRRFMLFLTAVDLTRVRVLYCQSTIFDCACARYCALRHRGSASVRPPCLWLRSRCTNTASVELLSMLY